MRDEPGKVVKQGIANRDIGEHRIWCTEAEMYANSRLLLAFANINFNKSTGFHHASSVFSTAWIICGI